MSPLPADLGDGAVLRRLTMDDLDEIWALVDVERPRLEPWMPWTESTRTIDPCCSASCSIDATTSSVSCVRLLDSHSSCTDPAS